jgi:3-phosphoshikimate 1-carboxyvinyltransferase
MSITLSHSSAIIKGEINLASSKSESNRSLIIQALCQEHFTVENLSKSNDTLILQQCLKFENSELDIGLAGTAMRFLSAFLSIKKGDYVLTGTGRMKERPIGVLVNALKELGADIEYLESEGYPPLKIVGKELKGGKIIIDGSVSSQYISALLMIAPQMDNGIRIEFEGEVISKPYINMTIVMMRHFGASVFWKGSSIVVMPVEYKSKNISIEADWSAASYWYSIVALSQEADVTLLGLKEESLQGDAVVQEIYIDSTFNYDFSDCPDIAQTVAVTCAALKIEARLTGLKTLRIKETDRIVALQVELNRLGYNVGVETDDVIISPEFLKPSQISSVKTYDDHRMAMAFAPLALFNSVSIEDEGVVAKSYPNYWKDLKIAGFLRD